MYRLLTVFGDDRDTAVCSRSRFGPYRYPEGIPSLSTMPPTKEKGSPTWRRERGQWT